MVTNRPRVKSQENITYNTKCKQMITLHKHNFKIETSTFLRRNFLAQVNKMHVVYNGA